MADETVTYYYDSYNALAEWTNEGRAFDGLLTTSTSGTNGDRLQGTGTTGLGTDLGAITKVEIKGYGASDGNDQFVIADTADRSGNEASVVFPTIVDWSSYIDATTWKSWLWSLIQTHNMWFHHSAVAKANSMICRKIEIRVTYTAAGGYYHGLKVQGVGELALCDVGTHPLRIRKGGTTYGIELVATDDPNASALRIKTPSGIKAIRKYT